MNITELPEEILIEIFSYLLLPIHRPTCSIFNRIDRRCMKNRVTYIRDVPWEEIITRDMIMSWLHVVRGTDRFTTIRLIKYCVSKSMYDCASRILSIYVIPFGRWKDDIVKDICRRSDHEGVQWILEKTTYCDLQMSMMMLLYWDNKNQTVDYLSMYDIDLILTRCIEKGHPLLLRLFIERAKKVSDLDITLYIDKAIQMGREDHLIELRRHQLN